MKRGAFEISFNWLFSIIVGGFILFLAIYASVRLIDVGEREISAEAGREIGILLNPLETGFESSRSSSFEMPAESRIFAGCDEFGEFGSQTISVSQKSFGDWIETDLEVRFSNKYIFASEFVEGRKFYVFSKPLDFPFKVTDLIYLTSTENDYCFVNSPNHIEREISNLNQENLLVSNCTERSVKVCFDSGSGCNVEVDYLDKSVSKSSGVTYFEGDALMYAAIFSPKEIYECQVKRVMKRIDQLSSVYQDKILIISREGCDSNIDSDLSALSILVRNLESSASLERVSTLTEEISEKNRLNSGCKLW